MVTTLLLLLVTSPAEPPLVISPGYDSPAPYLLLPPALEDRLVYYRSFDATDGSAELDPRTLQATSPQLVDGGLSGRCALTSDKSPLSLRETGLSPVRPLSLAFWWSLEQPCPEQGGYLLCHLDGGPGFVSLFARGGPWCGLSDTAAVFQIYNVPGVQNINGIYDRRVRQTLDLTPGAWHHTALTFAGGETAVVYLDGRPVYAAHVKGRPLNDSDQLVNFWLGARYGPAIRLDEVMVLGRTVLAETWAEYVAGVRAMVQAYRL